MRVSVIGDFPLLSMLSHYKLVYIMLFNVPVSNFAYDDADSIAVPKIWNTLTVDIICKKLYYF